MTFKVPVEGYKGNIVEVVIGKGDRAVTIGGENVLAFNQAFDEGEFPNSPKIALEVWDTEPQNWAPWVLEPYRDVASDPVAWAKRCEELGADFVYFYLLSADPNEKDTPPDQAAELVKRVYEAVNIPLIVYTTGNESKDPAVLAKVAEILSGENLLFGPAIKEDFEPIANAAKEHDHCVVSQAPVDINLQKELDVKLTRILPREKIVLDPLASALGYGVEYCFSVQERTKHVGVMFQDAMMQMPIIANFASEVWKNKEPKEKEELGIAWEEVTAMTYVLAGADILVMRHPEVFKIMREMIS
ncbi:MAG: acetyl-CoA decarbonylase/synthase complex subunit delta [Deltaproteobacteria bacterium]|nr:MAG: acetyl-CoA decarbonylase/synthase complex subunit delta [Deltaproteobacteria bacterium]